MRRTCEARAVPRRVKQEAGILDDRQIEPKSADPVGQDAPVHQRGWRRPKTGSTGKFEVRAERAEFDRPDRSIGAARSVIDQFFPVADDDIGAGRRRGIEALRQCPAQQQVVGIEKYKPLPRSLGDAAVPCSRNSAARASYHAQRGLETACDAVRIIRRSVIDANDFDRNAALRQRAHRRAGEPCLRIPKWNNNRYHSQPRPRTRFAAINALAPAKPKTRDDQANEPILWRR
jgi:hypothetical protein